MRAAAGVLGAVRRRVRRPVRFRWQPMRDTALLIGITAILLRIVAGRAFQPRSDLGQGFGIAAAATLLVVMLYSIRRSLPAVRSLGPAQFYLQLHVAGGTLFLVLLLLHTDFRLPSGPLMIVLWTISLWVVLSGAFGLALQRVIPRLLDAGASFEVNLQRIPELVQELRSRASAVAARAGPRVQAYYAREIAPDMEAPQAALRSVLGRSRSESYRSQEFHILRQTVPADVAPALDELEQIHNTKLEMDLHYTLQRWLRLWLWLHLPVAMVLLGLVVLHVSLVLYY